MLLLLLNAQSVGPISGRFCVGSCFATVGQNHEPQKQPTAKALGLGLARDGAGVGEI